MIERIRKSNLDKETQVALEELVRDFRKLKRRFDDLEKEVKDSKKK